jgi:hypothetical protein
MRWCDHFVDPESVPVTVPLMRDFRVNHSIRVGGKIVSQGKCQLHLDDAFLVVQADRASRVGYEQLESFRQTSDGIEIQMFPEGSIRFDGMDGAVVRPLFVHLSHLRGLRWAYLLRYIDGTPTDTLECKVKVADLPEQEALLHLYSSGLVGMPFGGEPFRLPMGDLQSIVRTPDYRLVCSTDELTAALYGCEPTYLGRFQRSVEGERRKMEEETSHLLVELFPALEFAEIVELTKLLARGRAASKGQLDPVVPWLWERIEELVQKKAVHPESYAQIKGRAGERLWFGLRRLSEGEMHGEGVAQREQGPPAPEAGSSSPEAVGDTVPQRDFLFWFLAGVKDGDRRFLVVEVDSGQKGYATYVYRCLGGAGDADAYGVTASTLSRAMVGLNFYRDPVYAPQKDIDSGRFGEYKLAVRKLNDLKAIRKLFVGRVIHSSLENWTSGLQTLLSKDAGL